MYIEQDLIKNDYFYNVLKTIRIDFIVDSLTGLINRKYMLEYIKDLIAKRIEFTMAIVDLDNFKAVNDQYGHATGDYILERVGSDLINYVGTNGLVGRFGGDEFIIVIFGKNNYDDIHEFYSGMIHEQVFRKKHIVSNDVEVFVTSTIGSARFPHDALTFDELFANADKTLYRGKTKGRNCFIIYVHNKHKDLQIQKITNDDLPTMMFNINAIYNDALVLQDKLKESAKYIKENLNLDHILLADKDGRFFDMEKLDRVCGIADFNSIKFNNELAQILFRADAELIFENANELNLSSLLITRLKRYDDLYGYVMLSVGRNGKIWETNETGALMYLAKTLLLEAIIERK